MNVCKIGQKICLFLTMCLAALFLSACDSGDGKDKDNNPGDPVAITGGSVLRVSVQDDISNIYFDNNYIGTVAPGNTQDFKVPTGEHVVKFTNAEKDNQKPDSLKIVFQENTIHTVTVKWKEESIF